MGTNRIVDRQQLRTMKKFFVLVAFAAAAGFALLPAKRRRMHKIYLLMPEIDGRTVIFRWQIEPMTTLYRRCSFRLTFPAAVDLSRVPARLWCDCWSQPPRLFCLFVIMRRLGGARSSRLFRNGVTRSSWKL
jgi:hypothetical protein